MKLAPHALRLRLPRQSQRNVTVSVVVPCYNYGRFLAGCVSSVLTQEDVEVDVLIVDDASTDGSGLVACNLARSDQRVRVIQHSRNRGHIATYNEGLRAAQGDYVTLLSADDLLAPGALSRATSLMEHHPSVGLVYGRPRTFATVTPRVSRRAVSSWSIWPGAQWIAAQCKRGLSCIYSPEAVVRTTVQHKVGDYKAALPHTADLEMWLRIAATSDVGRVNGYDQAYRRIHEDSMMQTEYGTLLADLKGRAMAYNTFFSHHGSEFSGSENSHRIVRCRLAAEALEQCSHLLQCADASGEGPNRPEIEPYIDFARSMSVDLKALWQWRELCARLSDRSTSAGIRRTRHSAAIGTTVAAMRRDVEARYRWRRWSALGV